MSEREGLPDGSEACYGVQFGDDGSDKKTGGQTKDDFHCE